MSLTGALHNAFSGLTANARAASLVSTNIANASTESYGRRMLGLASAADGTTGGVRITGVTRVSDPVLLADRMMSDAALGYSGSMFSFASRLEGVVGQSGVSGSLTDRINMFESALSSAASNPASTQRLELVSTNGQSLANALNALSDEVQGARQRANAAIGSQVDSLNAAVKRLEEINKSVVAGGAAGTDVTSLLDERQRLLDSVSGIVPLRVAPRENGAVAVYTGGGAVLLDGRQFEVGFEPTLAVGPGMTLGGGQLNGLTLNGYPAAGGANGMFGGGTLSAQFEIRDETSVQRQAELDGIARDLIERLGPGGPDTTLGPTDPGLFTDSGAAFDPLDETGIAGRIRLNGLVAPGSAELWRLRDGLGAATQGEVGDARLLQAISGALNTATLPGSSSLAPVARSFVDHVSEFSSSVAGARVRAENEQTFQSGQNTSLKEMELSKGVDTDQELQRLMQIEQLYTANAKVMSTVDELLERLMAI